ncbi:helix-turn-helix domain-containing protein [Spirosoma sp. KNUC1025]
MGERIGVAESTLNRFENGSQNLTLETLKRISDALETDLQINLK